MKRKIRDIACIGINCILLTQPLNPLLLTALIYLCILFGELSGKLKGSVILDDEYDRCIIMACAGSLAGILVGVVNGVEVMHIFRYSGGLLLLPVYFWVRNISYSKKQYLLKCIIMSMAILSTAAIVSLVLRVCGIVDFAVLIEKYALGGGGRSGFGDYRFLSLSVMSAVIPFSYLLIFRPVETVLAIGGRTTYKNIYVYCGVALYLCGMILLFSKSTIFYFITLLALNTNKAIRFSLCSIRLPYLVIFLVLPIIVAFIFTSLSNLIDAERLLSIVTPFSEGSNNASRIDQVKYLLTDIPILGTGSGASVPKEIISVPETPYGVELSFLNAFRKFGLFSLLFLPLLRKTLSAILSLSSDRSFFDSAIYGAFCTYLFFALGNPVLFHPQLNVIAYILFAFCAIEEKALNKMPVPMGGEVTCTPETGPG